MFSELDSGSSPEIFCSVFGKTRFSQVMPLSTRVYQWVSANLMLGCNPAMD